MPRSTPEEVAKNKPPANTVVHLTQGRTAAGPVQASTSGRIRSSKLQKTA
jgi:hypothetical protein